MARSPDEPSRSTPLAPLWVWLVLGETPRQATLIGGGVVMAAVIWHTLQSTKPQQDQ